MKYPLGKDKPAWPSVLVKDVVDRYPNLKDRVNSEMGYYPWAAWLSDCEWNKYSQTLLLTREKLDKISIPARSVESLIKEKRDKVIVVWSDTTGVWYPFTFAKELTTTKYAFFAARDSLCPVNFVILERDRNAE